MGLSEDEMTVDVVSFDKMTLFHFIKEVISLFVSIKVLKLRP